MADDFIKIDPNLTTQKYASKLIHAITLLKTVKTEWKEIADLMGHMSNGSAFTSIETYFGLPPGTGQGTLNIATGVVTALDTAAVNTVTGGRAG